MLRIVPWIFTVIILICIIAGTNLPAWMSALPIVIALILDLIVVRYSLLMLRLKLANKGLELGQLIPSTLIIFGWLIYAVVHFQIFLAIVQYLNLPAAALKWIFPLTAFKALWPVYYLGTKLPGKKQLNYFLNSIAFQLPWAIGGAIIWWLSNSTERNDLFKIVWAITVVIIAISPGLLNARSFSAKINA